MPEIVPLVNEHCRTGENPFWHPGEQAVYWVDIPAGKLFRFDPATGKHRTVYEGEQVGGFTLQADGRLLLFRVKDFAAFDVGTGRVEVLGEFTEPGMARFNDVMADPEGRVYAGTIGTDAASGGLYRVDRDGTVHPLFHGTRVSNGMGFTPDLTRMYWTDSTAGIIHRFRYDRATGALSEREVVHMAGPGDATPDGMVVDAAGDIWSARWDGCAVLRIGPDGVVRQRHAFPVAKISSLCFGGENLDVFYVTTAGGAADRETADGTLYRFQAGVRGPDRFVSRILL